MVSEMLWRKKVLIAIVITLAVVIGHACQLVYQAEVFFRISLTDSTGPIDELITMPYALTYYAAGTPLAVDARGNIYLAGRKDSIVRILVLSPNGKIKRVITPRLKNGQLLKYCLLSVSPSGNCVWTVSPTSIWFDRVAVHNRDGKAQEEWEIRDCSSTHLLINAYSENSAYLATSSEILHFAINQKYPQKFEKPFFPLFLHKGKYWQVGRLDCLLEEPCWSKYGLRERISQPERFWGIVTWTPKEGPHLINIVPIRDRIPIAEIVGIDQNGNFYCYESLSLKTLIGYFLNFLFKIKPLEKILQIMGISPTSLKRKTTVIKVVSNRGEILNLIPLLPLLKARKGEVAIHGLQIVKIDEMGIYMEVIIAEENAKLIPKEYRIIRIVKKQRWKVWFERLRRSFMSV